MTIHSLADGLIITTFPPPPAGFDLEKATDRERAHFGIPRFPPGSYREKRLREMAAGIRLVEPTFLPRDRRRRKLPQVEPSHLADHTAFATDVWSGAVTQDADAHGEASGDRIWSVSGSWTIPEVFSPPGAQVGVTYTASSWIGIDGFYGDTPGLLQAGCDADVTYVSPGYVWDYYQYNPWWEWYPGGSHWITGVPATSKGDQYTCSIQCMSLLNDSASANSASVYLANTTHGLGSELQCDRPHRHYPARQFCGMDCRSGENGD